MKMNYFVTLFLSFVLIPLLAQNPGFEDVLSVQEVSGPRISPDGQNVVFHKSSVEWESNRRDTELWLSKNGQKPFQLTNTRDGSSTSPKWSPDGKWIAFLSNRNGKNQVQVLRTEGGEALQVTNTDEDISSFEWSPQGDRIAFLQRVSDNQQDEKRSEKFGAFQIEDEDYKLTRLWIINFVPERFDEPLTPKTKEDSLYQAKTKATILIDSADFTITSFQWSPDGSKIAFNAQPDPIITSFMKSDIYLYEFEQDTFRPLVENNSTDMFRSWSPDGLSFVYTTDLEDNVSNFYKNGHVFIFSVDEGIHREVAKEFDEELQVGSWNPDGIFGIAWQKTERKLVCIDPSTGEFKPLKQELKGFMVSTIRKIIPDWSLQEQMKMILRRFI